MIEIKMDEAGYEVYYSLDEAVKAFSHNIALENATLDLDIGLVLESDVDPFSNYGMEAISERVKEMASKAKSNFVLYAKKFINFFFGWLIKFIQGTVNVKKGMSEGYKKAQKYLKALNQYETQARQSNEKTIEITNAGNVVAYGLTVIQLIIQSIHHIGNGLSQMKDGISENTSAYGKGLQIMVGLTSTLNKLYATIAGLPTTNDGAMEKAIRRVNFDIGKLYNIELEQNSDKTAHDKTMEAFDKDEAVTKNARQFGDKLNRAGETAAVNMKSDFKTKMESAKKFMSTPEKQEMKCPQAFDYLKTQLSLFIGISKANKWDVEKYVKSVESTRRNLNKMLDKLQPSAMNEDVVKKALSEIIEVGNMLGKLQNSASSIFKGVSRGLNMLMTDVTKLGSIITTIGGGPAKDKDAEEE